MKKPLSFIEHSLEIKTIFVLLTTLIENWDKSLNVNIIQLTENARRKEKKVLTELLATKINSANAVDHNQFTSSTKFEVKKPKIYSRVMQGLYAAK